MLRCATVIVLGQFGNELVQLCFCDFLCALPDCRLSQAVTHVPGVMVPSRYLQDSAVFVRQLLAIYAWCYTRFDTNVFTLNGMK